MQLRFYIDPDTCIDCNACVPVCPYEAIFPEDEVPADYEAKGGERQSMPVGTPGFEEPFVAHNEAGSEVHIPGTRELQPAEVVDLKPDIQPNYDFYSKGAGYWEGWQAGVAADDPDSITGG